MLLTFFRQKKLSSFPTIQYCVNENPGCTPAAPPLLHQSSSHSPCSSCHVSVRKARMLRDVTHGVCSVLAVVSFDLLNAELSFVL